MDDYLHCEMLFSGFEIAERVDIARAIETRVFITEYLVRYRSFLSY